MKKLITLFLVAIPLLSYAQDSTKTVMQTFQEIQKDSTFQSIYHDVKSGLSGLGEALKVGAEHVYEILVKQQIVNAVVDLILILVFASASVILIRLANSWSKIKGFDQDATPTAGIIGVFCGAAALIAVFFWTDDIVMGFINPEYGAIKDILDFVK